MRQFSKGLSSSASALLEELLPVDMSIEALDAQSPIDDISTVADVPDAILRNALITHNYWRIATRFYRRAGIENLVWPTFGSWASAQAGLYMRLGVARPVSLATAKRSERVTSLLGLGNQLIFRDIAPPFWRFLSLVETSTDDQLRELSQDPALDTILSQRLAIDPRTFAESPNGGYLMVLAFGQYLRALVCADTDQRAERIFVANGCMGLQEQTRVDRMLDELLDVPSVNSTFTPILTRLRPPLLLGSHAVSRAWPTLETVLGNQGPAMRQRLKNFKHLLNTVVLDGRVTQVVGTQIFLELQLGADYFDLGHDIDHPHFARGLDEITLDASDFRRSFEWVAKWDRTPDSTIGSAAVDWSSLSDRMNFILDLFRCYQGESRLGAHPLLPKD